MKKQILMLLVGVGISLLFIFMKWPLSEKWLIGLVVAVLLWMVGMIVKPLSGISKLLGKFGIIWGLGGFVLPLLIQKLF